MSICVAACIMDRRAPVKMLELQPAPLRAPLEQLETEWPQPRRPQIQSFRLGPII